MSRKKIGSAALALWALHLLVSTAVFAAYLSVHDHAGMAGDIRVFSRFQRRIRRADLGPPGAT